MSSSPPLGFSGRVITTWVNFNNVYNEAVERRMLQLSKLGTLRPQCPETYPDWLRQLFIYFHHQDTTLHIIICPVLLLISCIFKWMLFTNVIWPTKSDFTQNLCCLKNNCTLKFPSLILSATHWGNICSWKLFVLSFSSWQRYK